MNAKEIIVRLNEITSDFRFIYVISSFIRRDFCGPMEDLEHRRAHDHFNYNEASFLIGLWVKNLRSRSGEHYDLYARFEEVYSLMEQLHFTFISEGPKLLDNVVEPAKFLSNGFLLKEAFFYSSTGAYDYQYAKRFAEKYHYDVDWLQKNKGFGLSSASTFFAHIKTQVNNRLNDRRYKTASRLLLDDYVYPFTFTRQDLTKDNVEFDRILSNFTIALGSGENSQLNEVGDFNEFQTKPFIKIDNDRYFVPMPYYVAEALYESPFYWMTSDKTYLTECLKHRGLVGEEIVYTLFQKVFGQENTFKEVIITENRTKTITDIDVCGIYKDIAIVVQVKSKKLTAISKQGDIEKIKDDFKKAVEDSFIQGLECEKAVLNSSKFNFILNGTDEDVRNKFQKVQSVYIICVVLDVFPGLSHLSHIFLYEKFEESTICFSVFDLEVICRYLNTPAKLVDYFSKRIKNCRYYHAENELCFLGFYMEHGLKKHEKFNGALIESDYGSKIDKLYYPELSGHKVQTKGGKIGRNEKCPCGSGLKYKNCRGRH